MLWRVRGATLLILFVIFLCRAAGDISDEAEAGVDTQAQATTATSSSAFSSESLSSESRTFTPILNEQGDPSSIEYYERENGEWAVRYYDQVGLVDLPVPWHFRKLSDDRVVYELRWNVQTGGNWTERTTLEIIYHALMEPPVRDESVFAAADNMQYHPKAALKQQQRQSYFLTASRRTYQQYVRENAIAAATAHRAGGLTGLSHLHPSSFSGLVGEGQTLASQLGVPIVARKMDTAYGWLRDDVDICEWEGVVCGDFSATSQYYWNTAGIMTTLNDDNKYIQQEKWTCDHCPDLQQAAQHVTKLELPYAGLVGTLPTEVAMLRYLHRLDLRGNRIYGSLPTTLHEMEYLQYLDLTRNDLSGTIAGVTTDPEQTTTTPETSPPPQSFPKHIREVWLGSNKLHGTIPLDWHTPLLMHLDLSKNQLTGSLPRYGRKQLPKLKSLLLEDNQLTGKLPPKWAGLTNLEVVDVGGNRLNGTIPTLYGTLSNMRELNIVGNTVSGTIPTELLQLTQLESLMLSENQLMGTIPAGDDTVPHRAMREPEAGYKWSQLSDLQFFHASDNFLTATIPPDLFYGLSNTIQRYVLLQRPRRQVCHGSISWQPWRSCVFVRTLPYNRFSWLLL